MPATGAMDDMPEMMNLLVPSPNPPSRAATVGTAISATNGDNRLAMMTASSTSTVAAPSKASMNPPG
jgi:hypothetical protein